MNEAVERLRNLRSAPYPRRDSGRGNTRRPGSLPVGFRGIQDSWLERMFGIGPTELAFFLVIVLLAVGPERLPTFMRTVGKGMRQIRNASREFKEAIGFDELMREGDPFNAPPVRPPRARQQR